MSNDQYQHQAEWKTIVKLRPIDFSNVNDVQKIYEQQLEIFNTYNELDVKRIKQLLNEVKDLKLQIKILKDEQSKNN